jgi:predicted GIY-YIG superfamily endonuclease
MITASVLKGNVTDRRYVGITNNLERRLSEHAVGGSHSGRLMGPFGLLYTESFDSYHAPPREISQVRPGTRMVKTEVISLR